MRFVHDHEGAILSSAAINASPIRSFGVDLHHLDDTDTRLQVNVSVQRPQLAGVRVCRNPTRDRALPCRGCVTCAIALALRVAGPRREVVLCQAISCRAQTGRSTMVAASVACGPRRTCWTDVHAPVGSLAVICACNSLASLHGTARTTHGAHASDARVLARDRAWHFGMVTDYRHERPPPTGSAL